MLPKKFRFVGLLILFALSGSVFAVIPQNINLSSSLANHFEVIGGLGSAIVIANDGELGITQSETDQLRQTNKDDWKFFASNLGAGFIYHSQKIIQAGNTQWFTAIEPELNLYYVGNSNIQGDVWRFRSSAFNDLVYQMPFTSTRLMIDTALTIVSINQFSLYAIAGLGAAWNKVRYSDIDVSDDTCQEQRLNLNSKTTAAFAWEAGAGLRYDFNPTVGLSIEYLYTSLGFIKTAASGNTNSITTPVIVPARFDLHSQTGFLTLHIAL